MRSLASGKAVTQFSVATNEYIGQGKEKAEYHNIVTWDRGPLGRTAGLAGPIYARTRSAISAAISLIVESAVLAAILSASDGL
jgi:hypothetical protein